MTPQAVVAVMIFVVRFTAVAALVGATCTHLFCCVCQNDR